MSIIFEITSRYGLDTEDGRYVTMYDPEELFVYGEGENEKIADFKESIIICGNRMADFALSAVAIDESGANELSYLLDQRFGRTHARYVSGEYVLENPQKNLSGDLAEIVAGLDYEEIDQFGLGALHKVAIERLTKP